MTPAVTEALLWRGITPPPYGSKKTRCPRCSHLRVKAEERCLSVYVRGWGVEWTCWHCAWTDGEAL